MSILKPPKFLISAATTSEMLQTVKSIFHEAEERAGRRDLPLSHARAHTLARLSGKLDLKADNF